MAAATSRAEDFCRKLHLASQKLTSKLPAERQVVLWVGTPGFDPIKVDHLEYVPPETVCFIRIDRGPNDPETVIYCNVSAVNVRLTSEPVSEST